MRKIILTCIVQLMVFLFFNFLIKMHGNSMLSDINIFDARCQYKYTAFCSIQLGEVMLKINAGILILRTMLTQKPKKNYD